MKGYGSFSVAWARFGSVGLFGQQPAAKLSWAYLETPRRGVNGSMLGECELENHEAVSQPPSHLSFGGVHVLFAREKSVISRHLKSIFDSSELQRQAVVAKKATTVADCW